MAISVGMVCEGSHDFNVISRFLKAIYAESGLEIGSIDCLQPQVAATFQTTAGGWSQVKAWCQAEDGQGYRKHFDKPLFATSKSYDLLLIHLDGDVVEHCDVAPLTGLQIDGMQVDAVIEALKAAILESWLTVEPAHAPRIVACVPVRHLEAWLSVGLDQTVVGSENRDMKDEFRRGPIRRGRAPWREKYITAATRAAANLAQIRAACHSYQVFEKDFSEALAQA